MHEMRLALGTRSGASWFSIAQKAYVATIAGGAAAAHAAVRVMSSRTRLGRAGGEAFEASPAGLDHKLDQHSGRPKWLDVLMLWWLVVGVLAIGAFYVWAVPPGLPYDEPSHWATVLYYGQHAQLPVLGDPGVTYEAQQGPIAYVIDAVAERAVRGLGFSANVAFRVVRFVGLFELAAAALLIAALVRRTIPIAAPAAAAVALVVLDPMLLTMSASVQNDTLALALGVLTLYLALTLLSIRPTIAAAAGIGFVAGLAVLTKLNAIVVVPAIGGWLIWRHGRAAAKPLVTFLLALALTSGWWFIRNAVLYRDITAAKAVRRTGVSFSPYHVHSLGAVGHIVEEIVTYLWLPTEYLRNTISASVIVKAGIVLLTVLLLYAGLTRLRGSRQHWLVTTCALLSVLGWLVTDLFFQNAAPRVAYMALPLWVLIVAMALSRLRKPIALGVCALVVVSLNVWTLYEVQRVRHPPSPVGERVAAHKRGSTIATSPSPSAAHSCTRVAAASGRAGACSRLRVFE